MKGLFTREEIKTMSPSVKRMVRLGAAIASIGLYEDTTREVVKLGNKARERRRADFARAKEKQARQQKTK